MGCLACDLTSGDQELPGGRIFETEHWVVEHCVGPLGVGTLIVKPFRHCTAVAELSAEESLELGPLLSLVARCVRDLNDADQVYVCLWSHAGWTPGHIHFVIQPARDSLRSQFDKPGPFLQVAMFEAYRHPDLVEVQAFCDRARLYFQSRNPGRDLTSRSS
jgi:diadenosine tetraphosphate (Ap4A) HIT family hydrolase